MKFSKVLWSDISNIFHNRFIRASIVAVILIPLIYGGLYLAAFWDPYGKTQNIPIAVVNLDKGGIMDEKNVNFGDDVVYKLKDNKDLGWKFVKSQKEAEEGLKGDKYYAMIVIPGDFSQKIIDVDKGKLNKPKFVFVTNRKKNYVVGLISDKASIALKKDVSKSIMDNFASKVFDNLYELRDGMEAAADGTSQIKDGVTELKDKIPAMADGMGKLYDGSSTLNDKLKDASEGSDKLRDGLGTLNGKMPDLVDGVSKLYKGSSTITEKIGDAKDGSKRLRDGVIALNDKLPDLSDGVNDLYDGSTTLKEGLGELNDSMPKLVDGIYDLRDGARAIKNGLETAKDGSTALAGGVKQLEDGAAAMQSQLADKIVPVLKANLGALIPVASKISGGIAQMDSAVPSDAPIKPNSKEALEIANRLVSTFNNLSEGIESSDTKKINDNFLVLGKMLNGDAPKFEKSQLSKAIEDLDIIETAVPALKVNTTALKGAIQSLDGALGVAKDPLKLFQGTGALKQGAETVKTQGADALNSGLSALYDGSVKVYNGLDELYDKSVDLQDGVGALYGGTQNLKDGLNKFKGTVPDLTNGVSNLTDGTRDLYDGLFKLNEGSKTMTEKMGELNQKVPDLQEGVQELYDGSTDLSDGLIKLYDGSGKLKDGLGTLKSKIPDMQDGVDKLYEGVVQLNDKLAEGASKLSDKLVASGKAMGKYISEPVNLKDKPLYEVAKYGEGMAPYFISLSLWVGALMMFFVITDEVNPKVKAGPMSVVFGKYLSYSILGLLQAIFISIVVLKLGLRPTSLPLYFGFNIFLSLVFIAIIQNFIFLFGDVGRLIAIIVLVLQLTSSNGTFPGELLPKFFRALGPFLPFTYSISAMREINSGIDKFVLLKDVGILAGILVFFLLTSVLLKGHLDNIKGKMGNKNKLKAETKEITQQITEEDEVAVAK